jgi:hypothetical protein
MNIIESDLIFNTPLETGIRTLCILTVNPELQFDLQELIAFDYLVVHTGDFKNAPSSLHLDLPSKAGELVIRRNLIERGLMLMEYKKLVCKLSRPDGFYYSPTDFATIFIESLTNSYIQKLVDRAKWAIDNFGTLDKNIFETVYNSSIGTWSKEFQTLGRPFKLNARDST